ncbi:hypothetical protein L2E82_32319 [Cichorium intybus]|uniref:Uncharacterized protein n=1 Tax=Cichorium intybus TaxID=13427 RepID=A0ACB9BGG9_CICIN|nr:hypothetical protein L2E82_32319 [Cichorium intybus]
MEDSTLFNNEIPQSQSKQQQGQRQHQEQPYSNTGNILNGFDVEFLEEAFNVDRETAEKLQGQRDQRGHIVNVERELRIIRPLQTKQEQEQEHVDVKEDVEVDGAPVSISQTSACSFEAKGKHQQPHPHDFINPQASQILNLNGFKFTSNSTSTRREANFTGMRSSHRTAH